MFVNVNVIYPFYYVIRSDKIVGSVHAVKELFQFYANCISVNILICHFWFWIENISVFPLIQFSVVRRNKGLASAACDVIQTHRGKVGITRAEVVEEKPSVSWRIYDERRKRYLFSLQKKNRRNFYIGKIGEKPAYQRMISDFDDNLWVIIKYFIKVFWDTFHQAKTKRAVFRIVIKAHRPVTEIIISPFYQFWVIA